MINIQDLPPDVLLHDLDGNPVHPKFDPRKTFDQVGVSPEITQPNQVPINQVPSPNPIQPTPAPPQPAIQPAPMTQGQKMQANLVPPQINDSAYKNSKLRTVFNAIAAGLAGASGGAEVGMDVGSRLRDAKYNAAKQVYDTKLKQASGLQDIEQEQFGRGKAESAAKTAQIKATADEENKAVLDRIKQQNADTDKKREEDNAEIKRKMSEVTKPHNLTKVLARTPDGKVMPAFADPQNPGPLRTIEGQSLPEGTEAIDLSTNSAEIRASAYGEFGNLYRAAKGRGYDDAHARMIAGEQVQKHFNLTIGGKEQDIAIKGELSGIGGGSEGSLNNSTQDSSTTKVAKSISPNTPNKEGFPLSFNDKDRGYVDQFLQQLAGNIPAGRGGAAGQLGTKRGMELLAKAAGVDPMTFAGASTEIKGSAKQLSETIQRAGAIQRLNNTLALHGPIVNQTISKLTDTGSPILNEHIRDLGRLALSNPDLKAFHVALNTIQREYTYLTAGGAQSKAMLPVGTQKDITSILSPDMTIKEAAAVINQIQIEAKNETQAMKNTQRDIIDSMKKNILGQASGAKDEKNQGVSPKSGTSYKWN